jgi:hypothetical protein
MNQNSIGTAATELKIKVLAAVRDNKGLELDLADFRPILEKNFPVAKYQKLVKSLSTIIAQLERSEEMILRGRLDDLVNFGVAVRSAKELLIEEIY